MFEDIFPSDPRFLEWSCYISSQPWYISNEKEPPISSEDVDLLSRLHLVTDISSRFELFFEDQDTQFRCRWGEGDQQCPHVSPRRRRALGHIHTHFNYKPYTCGGRCGNSRWYAPRSRPRRMLIFLQSTERYCSASALDEHIRRRHNPVRSCPIWSVVPLEQNCYTYLFFFLQWQGNNRAKHA